MAPVSLRIAELRRSRGWSQAELARRSGVPQPTISRIEARKTNSIDLANLERLAEALEVNAAVLIDHHLAPRTSRSQSRGTPRRGS